MTTKLKIIVGFSVMIILMGVVAGIGYRGLDAASNSFDDYNRLAQADVNSSNALAELLSSSSSLRLFRLTRDTAHADEAMKNLDNMAEELNNCEPLLRIQANRDALKNVRAQMEDIRKFTGAIKELTLRVEQEYRTVMMPLQRQMGADLIALLKASNDVGNAQAVPLEAEAMNALAYSRSAISRFATTTTQKDSERTQEMADSMKKKVDELDPVVASPNGRVALSSLQATTDKYMQGLASMRRVCAELAKAGDAVVLADTQAENSLRALSDSILKTRQEVGDQARASNENAEKFMLLVSAVGLLLGVLFAALIIVGLISVLNNVRAFARAIADGDFDHRANIREKGEVGAMVEAMKTIPEVLKNIIASADKTAASIVAGVFRERLPVDDFSGSFAHLATAVNTVGNAYTVILDAIPFPIMACNKECTVSFFNKAAQSVVGGNHVATKCQDQLCAAECGTDKCLGKQCMAAKTTIVAETTISPQGRDMEVSVSAMPLVGPNGNVRGYFETITDLTSIKSQQNTILRAASQASEISNRVAAASEQLSAQVEQVSRGAEIQRTRVESTASAMNEMTSTVMEVARNASRASEQSDRTRAKAEEGAVLVNKVIGSINLVNSVSTALQGNMQELGSQAKSIGGVMNVISDIADQTNLLALNAAIEAARAGEAGRGFAVVADEVRKLAEKTMSATQEVGNSITAIQKSAQANVAEVDSAVKSIGDATELANSSGEALKEIVDLAASNSAVVASIATAAEEQSATSEEISTAIEEINRVVGETTDGMVQSSAAVQELSHMAQQLQGVMEGLK